MKPRVEAGGRGGERLGKPFDRLFLLLLLLMLVPVWAFRYFPSVDGPSHLYNAHVLLHHRAIDGELYQRYYEINGAPEPNWLTTLILAGLMAGFPALLAEKILLTLYVLLFPLAMRYALGSFGRRARDLSLLAFPFVYNWMLYMGFYNYVFSLAIFCLVVGYALRRRGRFGPREAAGMSLLATALYFCHLVSFIEALPALAIAMAIGAKRTRLFRFDRRWLRLALALAPAVFMAGWFFIATGLTRDNLIQHRIFYYVPWKIPRLITLFYTLVVFHNAEEIWSGALAFFLLVFAAGICWRKTRRGCWKGEDLLLGLVLVSTLFYLFAPSEMSRGFYLYNRIAIFPWLGLILWLGAQPLSLRLRKICAAAGLVCTMGLLFMHMQDTARWNAYAAEAASVAPHIEIGSTLWYHALNESSNEAMRPDRQRRVLSEIRLAAYPAIERNLVDLSDFEGATGYSPLIYRPVFNPFVHIGPISGGGPRYRLLEYQGRGPGHVDYVLICRIDEPTIFSDQQLDHLRQVDKGFERIFVSSPEGLFELYRARGQLPALSRK